MIRWSKRGRLRRQILLGDYRIIYRVNDNTAEIISIRHEHFHIRSPRSL